MKPFISSKAVYAPALLERQQILDSGIKAPGANPRSNQLHQPLTLRGHERAHAVPHNAHRQLHRFCFGAVTFDFPDSQAWPRSVGLRYMDRRVQFPNVCEHHYLAQQRENCGACL